MVAMLHHALALSDYLTNYCNKMRRSLAMQDAAARTNLKMSYEDYHHHAA